MNNTRTISVLVTVLALACASAANAQQATPSPSTMPLGGKLFINLNVAGQKGADTLTGTSSLPIHGETATITTTATVGGGPLFDLNVGYRFMPSFGVALGYSSFNATGTAQGSATIPHPVFFDKPATVAINPVDAKRTDRNISLLLVGFVPVAEKLELSVFLGPSFTRVSQDLIGNVSVPVGTQTVSSTLLTETGTAKGINIGADLAYQIVEQFGAGVFVRYNGGSVDLTSFKDVKVGGLQIGIGARVRF